MDPHNSNPYCSRINCTEFFHAQILCTAVYFQYIWYSFIGFSKFSLVFPWISWIFLIGLVAKYFTFSCNDKYFFQYILNWSLLALIFFFLFRAQGAVNGCVLHQTPGTRDGPGLRCRHMMAAHTYCHPSDPEHPPWERGPGPQGHNATSPASCLYPASHCWHF